MKNENFSYLAINKILCDIAKENDDDDFKDVLMMRSRNYEDKYDFSDEMWSKLNDR